MVLRESSNGLIHQVVTNKKPGVFIDGSANTNTTKIWWQNATRGALQQHNIILTLKMVFTVKFVNFLKFYFSSVTSSVALV